MTTSPPVPDATVDLGPDPVRARLRTAVARIDRALADMPASPDGTAAAPAELRASWAALVVLLALGPAPDLLPCPRCGRLGMRAATRCGHCWITLEPPPDPTT